MYFNFWLETYLTSSDELKDKSKRKSIGTGGIPKITEEKGNYYLRLPNYLTQKTSTSNVPICNLQKGI